MQSELPELPPDCWISKAFEYLRNKCKTPEPLLYWSLFAFAGAALRDKFYFDLSGKRIYPNFPLLLIGPSGSGKTGAITACKHLFDRCLPYEMPENCTPESFFKEMAKDGNSNSMWIIPELADVFGQKDYQKGSIAKITRILDNPKDLSVSRMSNEETSVIKGYALLNIIGASTFEWLIKYVESSASQGGFLPRFFIASTEEESKFVLDPERDYDTEIDLNSQLFKMLNSTNPQRITLTDELRDALKEIYDLTRSCYNPDIKPYYERMTENFLRVFMILKFYLSNTFINKDELYTTSITTSFSICKSFISNGLKLVSCITTNNNIDINILRKIINKLNKNTGKKIPYFNLYNGLHITSKQSEPVVRFLNSTNWIEWNEMTGRNGFVRSKAFIPFERVVDPENCYYIEKELV